MQLAAKGEKMARLTAQQKKKLPPEIRIILERFNHDPQLLMQLKRLLVQAAQKIQQQSINHETFCDTFQVPKTLPNELLKLYGTSEREMKQAMQKIGFVDINRMYNSAYYQTLCLAYLVGLEFDDENIRKMALLLIDIHIWNGRKLKSFPSFCDPDIARYVLNYVLKGNHTLKKVGSVFDYLDRYSIPAVDAKYSKTIPNNLDSYTEGLRKLIETNYSRFTQLFKSIRDAYYKTHKEGKKEIISGTYKSQYGNGEMVETHEGFSGNIERLVDKIQKNSMLKKNTLTSPAAKQIFKVKYNISDASIKKLNDWFTEDDNQDELKYFYELVFTSFKPKNEGDICKFDIPVLAMKITSSKKDPELLKAKEILDHVLISILGTKYNTLGVQSLYSLKGMVAYAFMIHAKTLLCKKL
jgi:hypothetical protein